MLFMYLFALLGMAASATIPASITALGPRQDRMTTCDLIGRNSHFIYLDGWGLPPVYDAAYIPCGYGLKEELEARCCPIINNWECGPAGRGPRHSAKVAFTLEIFCVHKPGCVEDAIYAVAPPEYKTEVTCV